MPTFFLCSLIGSGTDDDPYRPAINGRVRQWRLLDARTDETQLGDVLVLSPDDYTQQQLAQIIRDPDILHVPTKLVEEVPARLAATPANNMNRAKLATVCAGLKDDPWYAAYVARGGD